MTKRACWQWRDSFAAKQGPQYVLPCHPRVLCMALLLPRQVCQDIVRASSRTSSGGDTYAVVAELLSRPTEGDVLTPSGVESAPIGISVDGVKGEVVITVENRLVKGFYIFEGCVFSIAGEFSDGPRGWARFFLSFSYFLPPLLYDTEVPYTRSRNHTVMVF